MSGSNVERNIRASAATVLGLLNRSARIEAFGAMMVDVLQGGGKVLTAGNGGSAAEAMHMSEELIGRFRTDRRSLAAVALTADPTALTCIANDFGYDAVFSRQVEGLGRPGDLLVLFSTSGNARNLKLGLEAARSVGMRTVALLGRDGGCLAGLADCELIAPGDCTERIQEAHQVIVHLVLDLVEEAFS